ncbi:3-phosphoshikimate 1-carboxyvinyltransferase [Micromonospora sp. NPDC049282]|uniref:3-phosphoshikimate 1-carboxyvinyltransferase n=1 Tax=Micromonospora sp. NPDC049282 TaxID=3364269 RepID=UPI00371B609A
MGNLTATRPPQPWTAPTASDPVAATLRLPGSKSMTARALVLAALASGPSTLDRPLRARDTELMAGGLRELGSHMSISDDDRWLVRPHPPVGPAHIDVGLAGTVMRFLPPVAGLAAGRVTFDGDPYARTRPLGPLIDALRTLGVRIDAPPVGSLPLVVLGAGRVTGGEVVIDASASSQLVSGLLLAAPRFDRGVVVRHEGPPVPSAPHVRMTVQMLRAAGAAVDDTTPDVWVVEPGPLTGRGWEIEPDLSGAAPFFAAALVTGGEVTLQGWPRSSLQPVERLRELLQRMGGEATLGTDGLRVRGTGVVRGLDADLSDVGELTPVLTALALLADTPSRLTGVSHIRGHETDRVTALATEFTALGADLTETRDGLEIRPRPLRGGTFRTHADHRMAHAAAVAGLAVPGIEVDDVTCTSKTMPEFPALWSGMVTGKN